MISGIADGILGAAAGYGIGKYFQSKGGMCPLLCDPKISTVYFAVMGILLGLGGW